MFQLHISAGLLQQLPVLIVFKKLLKESVNHV